MLSKEGLADIIEWTEEFMLEGPDPGGNQTEAIHWELCAMEIASAWAGGYNFSVCLNQCTYYIPTDPMSLRCPQPAQNYMTPAKAEECAGTVGLQWSAVQSCVADRGEHLRLASQQRYVSQCPGCPGPTTFINGKFAGHHPGGTCSTCFDALAMICGNYTGVKPKGCPPP